MGKKLVTGRRWEPSIKRALFSLTGSKNYLYDALTVEIMSRTLSRDSNAIDVGAFEGGMLQHILRHAPRGRHFAFEPLPDRYAKLRRSFPSVEIYPYALSDTPGSASFHRVLRAPALSGLVPRSDLASDERVQEFAVEVETLDRIIPADLSIAFVKIDVEGGELSVLRGGRGTLRRTRPVIVFECGLGGSDAYDGGPLDLFQTITDEIGLKVSLLSSWLAGRPALSREQFVEQFDQSLNYYFVAHP